MSSAGGVIGEEDNPPQIHALLIGVSDYPALFEHEDDDAPAEHLGLRKLASPALTVQRFYEWLERRQAFLPLPLGSRRVLVSPTAGELKVAKGLAQWTQTATLANVLTAIAQWRADLARNPKSIALFYFAGHGVKRERRDDVLLLEEFGANPLRVLKYAIDSTSLIDGMAPSKQFPHIARTQVYIFDACRVVPKIFRKYESVEPDPIWDRTEVDEIDDRSMLVLFTTEPGAEAYGAPDDQSLFSLALIDCLDGAAAESSDPAMRKWAVTATSLASQLQTELDRINRRFKRRQKVEIGRLPGNRIVLNRLERPPSVEVSLQIEPLAARPHTEVSVLDGDVPALKLPYPVDPLPFSGTLDAGIYRVLARDPRSHPEWRAAQWFLRAAPQVLEWPLEISPLETS